MRIKRKYDKIMKVWEQIIEFNFIENGNDMKWKEKFFITSTDKDSANEISKKFIARKKAENIEAENFQYSIIEDLYISDRIPISCSPSIYSQIIDISVV